MTDDDRDPTDPFHVVEDWEDFKYGMLGLFAFVLFPLGLIALVAWLVYRQLG